MQEEEHVQISVALKNRLRQLLRDVNDTHIKTVSGETAQDEMKRGFWTHLEKHPLVIAARMIRRNFLLKSRHRACDDNLSRTEVSAE